jgi:Protein of unknown function (DUF3667)
VSGEIEAAGSAITAGLAAGAIERRGGHAAQEAHGACQNCGATLQGEYCHVCGQPSHISRTLGDVWHDFLHGVLHFDNKAWKTLPLLLFRPGTLTRQYIHGRRARFIGPVALFLFTVFLMFFVFALLGDGPLGARPPISEAETAEQAALLERAEARLEQSLAQAQAAGDQEQINAVRTSQRLVARAVEEGTIPPGLTITETPNGVDVTLTIGEGGGMDILFDEIRAANEEGRITVNTGNPEWDKKILNKLKDPEFAWYKIQNTAYKFSFLLVPIMLPFVWAIFFWKKDVTLFDHTVLLLYSLSFLSLVFMAMVVINRLGGPVTDGIVGGLALTPLAHGFFQMKGAYQLGWFSAAWRTLYMLIAGSLAIGLFIVVIFMLGLLG